MDSGVENNPSGTVLAGVPAKLVAAGIILMVLATGCISPGSPSNTTGPVTSPVTPVTVNQTPFIAPPPTTPAPVHNLTPNRTIVIVTLNTATPAALPTLTESRVAGDYCVRVDCAGDDWECQGVLRKYNTVDSCLHLSATGGASMWMRHSMNLASYSTYSVSGNRVLIKVPNGWTVDSGWPYNGAVYNGIYGREYDTVSCSFNGTALSCLNNAFTYMAATPDQL
ncbi:MAG: hypothetical protein WC342_02805 [Methanoregula sp.]